MSKLKFKVVSILFLVFPLYIFGQEIDFNHFKTTKAAGQPPQIFKETFQESVEYRKKHAEEVSEENREEYAEYAVFSLSNLLKSGFVLYGDPMTKFVQKVGKKLLQDHPELEKNIQFYVIKNNMTNALCTDPGVIFITTGLLAQIENEAQLALVMSHEIVHYQENHLQKSYNELKEKGLDPSMSYSSLVKLYKDHEFEADTKSLNFYNAAGYSKNEVLTIFDVLMYSYLPFDEISLDSTFFGNPKIYIPDSYFPEEPNPILAYEDYDDSKSSHPNIRKRKDAITEEMKKYDSWGDHVRYMSEEEFNRVQNIARFETIRENVILGNFLEALYEIYILEKQFPNNEYLQTTKAMVWSTLNQVSLSGRRFSFIRNAKDKEGTISLLYGFFRKLKKPELALLAMREVEDVYLKFPNSKIIKKIRNETIRNLAHVRNLKIDRLEKISFREALEMKETADTIRVSNDSIAPEDETKYDRIRRIRAQQRTTLTPAEITGKNFSQFLLYDLASNSTFHDLYDEEKEKIEKKKNEAYDNRRKHKKRVKYEGDILMLNPRLIAVDKNNNFDLSRTLEFYDLMEESIKKRAPEGRLYNRGIAFSENFTTKSYNESSLLTDYVLQLLTQQNNEFDAISFDYEEMGNFIKQYNDPYLLLIYGKTKKVSKVRNRLEGSAKYIHLKTGKITSSRNFYVNLKIRKASVGGLAFEVFSKF